jgi:hypothetical protein
MVLSVRLLCTDYRTVGAFSYLFRFVAGNDKEQHIAANASMKYRKLPIAWSVMWGLFAVLLCVLWIRSHSVGNAVQWSATKWVGFQLTSMQGQLTVRRCDLDGAGHHGGMDFPDWRLSQSRAGSFSNGPTTLGFNLAHLSFYIAFPYWAPVTFCLALAVAPVLIRHQRFRFSLRTLLIATTLVAVVLGIIAWLLRAG